MTRLVQLLPYRSTAPDGVADYAALLARVLADRHGIDTCFAVARPDAGTAEVADGFATHAATGTGFNALADVVARARGGETPCPLLIHMSGYGYHRFGAPMAVARLAGEWRRAGRGPVITIFHEIFVDGRASLKHRLYQHLQQRFVRAMLAATDTAFTPVSAYADWMKTAVAAPPPIHAIPVFSTVGEGADPMRSARPPRLALFCRAGMAALAYGEWREQIAALVDAWGIEEIADIGARDTPPPATVGRARVVAHGRLEAAALSALLSQCRAGFLAYQDMPLAKSTIFAAYAAHGVVPFCASHAVPDGDGLVAGTHYGHAGAAGVGPIPQSGLEDAMRHAVVDWYAGHTLFAQADAMARALGPAGGDAPR